MARTRTAAHQLVKLFESSSCPVCLVDDQRRIVYGNAALTQWVGVPVGELLGARCDYCAGDEQLPARRVAAALCPPPDVFLGARRKGRVYCPQAGGTPPHRGADFLPLAIAAVDACGALVVLSAAEDPDCDDQRCPPEGTADGALHELLQKLAGELRGPYRLDRLAGDSAAMTRVREQVQLAIARATHVVIMGPPGSGREQAARTIHSGRQPAGGSLLPLSCAALDAELLRSTARAFLRRCAAAPAAEVPTLLLLDADELAAEGQAELLTILREPGSRARALATTRQSLVALAERQAYSRELAYRLSTLVIELPSLAARREDLPLLMQQLLEERNARGGSQLSGFTADAIDALASLPWPGNVAELAAVVQDACARAAGPWITLADLPDRVRAVNLTAAHPQREEEPIVLDEFLADIEREVLRRALSRARGNKAQAARMLGIPRVRLLRRLTQLGLAEARLVWRPSEPGTADEAAGGETDGCGK